jgi:hypothetical protein
MGFELEWFFPQLLSDQNNWSLGNRPQETLNFELPQGFERSEAIEPFDRTQGRLLERLELATAYVKVVSTDSQGIGNRIDE